MRDTGTILYSCGCLCLAGKETRVSSLGQWARYVRHSQMCPQLDMSDKNDKKTGMICPTCVNDVVSVYAACTYEIQCPS